MSSRRALAFLGLLALAVGLATCATARNYLDPSGPVWTGGVASAPAGRAGRLRVVTFNIEHGRRVREAVAILQTRPELREADVIALQEMDTSGVAAIGEALHREWVYVPSASDSGSGRDIGTALLSRWPIEARWKVPLPHLTRVARRARAATAVRLRVGPTTVRVYSVHLGSPLGLSAGGRRDQARAVLADAAGASEPVVIAGDFNSHGLGRVFEEAGYTWLTREVGRTVHCFSFDHVFARGLSAEGAPAAGVVRDATGASDHRPVWATLTLPP